MKCCCFKRTQVFSKNEDKKMTNEDLVYEQYLEEEFKKPPLVDFTLSEYTEKGLDTRFSYNSVCFYFLRPI